MKSKYISLFILILCSFQSKGQGIKYLNDQPGTLIPAKHALPGSSANKIFEIFNKNVFITQPVGFDMVEYSSPKFNSATNVDEDYISFGFRRYLSYDGKGVAKQGEYGHYVIKTNNLSNFSISTTFNTESEKLKFPAFITDTVNIVYTTVDNIRVGKCMIPKLAPKDVYVLNPKMTPFFVNVSKGEYIKFLISYLKLNVETANKNIQNALLSINSTENDKNLKEDTRTKILAETNRSIAMSKLWIKYYTVRIAQYEQMQKLPSEALKERAFMGYPKKVATVFEKNGQLVDEITGYLDYDLASPDIESRRLTPLYHFNNAFFDAKLNKSSVQLIVLADITQHFNDNFESLLAENFFSKINYKLLSQVMYK